MFKILIRKSPHEIRLPANCESYKSTSSQFCTPESVKSEEASPKSNEEDDSNEEVLSLTSETYELALVDNEEELAIPSMQAFRVLTQFVTVLHCQLKVARKSLLQAAFDAPMHGVLFCIREILCDLELR